jgi:hypothetical protein
VKQASKFSILFLIKQPKRRETVAQTITVTNEDILHQVKLSCKVPETIRQIIERKIIIFAAKAAGIEPTKEELQKASDQMRVISKLKDAQATCCLLYTSDAADEEL